MSKAEQMLPHDLVVIGSSAGGIEALSVLVSRLPDDFPAPIVLAQHLDPNRPSTLDTILQRTTPLRVVTVSQHTTLEPGTIYVVPSNKHVIIQDGHVNLDSDLRTRPRPSVDLLLSTAAENYGERLIAVILTGSGTDGAVGAVEVKHAGGTVIVQNPATARYASMPLALPPAVVDHIADIDAIGPLLYELLTNIHGVQRSDTIEQPLQEILRQVGRQANIDFRQYKTMTILRRIGRRMTATQQRSMRDYAEYLTDHPEEIGALVEAFLINVTRFFRDPEVFTYLGQEIVPQIIEQARAQDRVLRCWSAGCATGEEAYSVAMLLADLIGPELAEWSIKIFATDLDEAAINFARNGIYPANLLEQLPEGYRERFFERLEGGKGYRIVKPLRQMVIFGQQDLSRSPPFPRIDLVLCRNVLIYFTPELQEYVLNRFAFSLQLSSGFLVLGKAEAVRPTLSYFELINKQWKTYRCLGGAVPLLRMRTGPGAGAASPRGRFPARPTLIEQETSTRVADLDQLRRLNEVLLRYLPVGIVVIDRSYRIVTANIAARRMLGLRELSTDQDFLHAVPGIPYHETRSAIDTVFRERSVMALPEVELDAGTDRYLTFSFVLMQIDSSGPDLVMISVSDVDQQVQIRRRLEASQLEQARLLTDLETANKRLSDTNKELLDANEELQVANEELVLTHEELQATVEEFETTNEELQAANEELETNNEELQATNEELQATNDELAASHADLQLMMSTLDTERARLLSLVELAPLSIVTLRGPNLIVESIDRRSSEPPAPQPIKGRPLSEVYQLLWGVDATIVELAARAYQLNEVQISPPLRTRDGDQPDDDGERYYVFTVVPARDHEGHAEGVILYVADETTQQRRQAEEEHERLRMIFDRTDLMALALYDAESGTLLLSSTRYLAVLRQLYPDDDGELIGTRWQQLALGVSGAEAAEVWSRALHSPTPLHVPELRTRLPAGGELIWDWSLTPIMDLARPELPRYLLLSALDITTQVQAREQIIQLDRMRDEFMSLASHELRTPLTSLIGYAHILAGLIGRAAKDLPADQQTHLDRVVGTIQRQLTRLHRLVEDLVDISRLQNGKLSLSREPLNLLDVVQQALAEARGVDAPIPIELAVAPDVAPLLIEGDASRLVQVIVNLLQNALTHAAESARIDLRVTRGADDATGQPVACIAVQDYGPGIPPEEQAAIFERFRQAHRTGPSHRGLGLGLFIAREIVEQHGGTLTVASTPGAGSTFTITLPLTG